MLAVDCQENFIKIVATGDRFYGQNAPKSILAGAFSQIPLGELTALAQTP